MKIKGLFLLLLITILSCKKNTNLNEELLEGAWLFQKVEDTNKSIIIREVEEPKIIFFFLDNEKLNGRLTGSYKINDDNLYLQAEIDTVLNHFFGDFELDRFPQRYYDFEAITKKGIQGKIIFYENGWDSKFSFKYKEDRIMWFKRY